MIKFHRQHEYYETESYRKIGNVHPWKVNDFVFLENLTSLNKPFKPVCICPCIAFHEVLYNLP